MKRILIQRVSIVIGLTACFALFQNFSLDNEYQDIRLIAPKGQLEEPNSDYLPDQLQSTTLNGLSSEIFKHNFNGQLHHLEEKFEDWGSWETHSESGRDPASGEDRDSYRLRTGLLGRDRVGLMFENQFRMKCEYSALNQDLQFSIDKDLNRKARISLKHKAESQQSSVNFSYDW